MENGEITAATQSEKRVYRMSEKPDQYVKEFVADTIVMPTMIELGALETEDENPGYADKML